MRKKQQEPEEYEFLSLEEWLKLHYPKLLREYEREKEGAFIIE